MSDDTHRIRQPRESGLSDAPTGRLRAAATLGVEAAGRTDKGRVRPGNEDAFGLEPSTSAQARAHGTLLVVSDGMGGHAAGEVASRLAVETVQTTYYRERAVSTAEAIRTAISTANSVIFNSAEQDATRSGMGCTIVVMVVQGSTLTVGHVGDSRGYLVRGGRAHQLTRDHSWVAMQVEEGVLTPEQAEHHPNRSLLMRALGRQPSVEVEIGQHQVQSGDVLILCSDGLTGVVTDAEIGEYASRFAPATAVDQLVDLANQRGAPDNVTVVAAAITGPVGGAVARDTTVTMAAPPVDAVTPRLGQAAAGLTTPMPRVSAAPSAPPAGAPIGVPYASVPPRPDAPPRGRRGRGRWLAGSLAAFGLAAGLVLLTLFGPRTVGDPNAPRATDPAVASKPAATPAAPAATVPPPVATGIPGLTAPGPAIAAAPPPAVASPVAAPSPPAAAPTAAVATPTSAASGKPAAPAAPALTAPPPAPSVPGGSVSPPRDGVAGPSSSATGAGTAPGAGDPGGTQLAPDSGAPADEGAPAENPEPGAPAMTEEPGGEGSAGDAAPPAEGDTAPAQPGASQPAPPAPRFIPGTSIPIPGSGPFRPPRRLGDD